MSEEQGFLSGLLAERAGQKFDLHSRHMNHQLVRVLKTIGFDRHYTRADGAYLYDEDDARYLDLLSGFGTFALGRNHPGIRDALREVLDAELPNLVQLDVGALAAILAEQLVECMPGDGLDKVFFANSGTETVEAAIKFARFATGRAGILYCEHGFHGLTMGSLALNGEEIFRRGFGPMLPDCHSVPFDDLDALDMALSAHKPAAFIFEPIQGKGVNVPSDDYLCEAQRLCRKHKTLFVADEVQTGLGRTGKMWAVEHWEVEPDMILSAKALSGGHVPVGAVVCKSWIFNKVFDRMDRAVVHGSTFAKNNLAMAAGLATLRALREERLVENAARQGEALLSGLGAMVERYEFVHAVRGKGLMIAIEFGRPKSLKLRTAYALLNRANKGLFCQMILIPLFKEHRILAQVAGHEMSTIKLLPPLVVDDEDVSWVIDAFERTVAACHQIPGALWDLGTALAGNSFGSRKAS